MNEPEHIKLVLVDDDAVLLRTLARRFEQTGASVVTFAEPCTSDQLIAEQADAYLLDLRFAGQSGLSFIEPLRTALPNCRIVLLTGYGSIANAVQAVKLGADDYLTKPVDFQQLLQVLCGRDLPAEPGPPAAEQPGIGPTPSLLSPEQLEWEHIQRVLAKQDGNISQTARVLGMHRRTLQRKLLKRRP
ncbi:response regulator transcription factor [Alkalimonas amylolytica]|uniref:Two-component system, response regulator RegA n=1 Tax=Alkalimonas amylolytica TaxID=152573 RepID=A0A1H4E9V0_ALKAM|nr:response regulator [Alkalimonas amylolytica]SEA81716.1 two-component system, response regulator RegA [Alkalimonas amylolytica]